MTKRVSFTKGDLRVKAQKVYPLLDGPSAYNQVIDLDSFVVNLSVAQARRLQTALENATTTSGDRETLILTILRDTNRVDLSKVA